MNCFFYADPPFSTEAIRGHKVIINITTYTIFTTNASQNSKDSAGLGIRRKRRWPPPSDGDPDRAVDAVSFTCRYHMTRNTGGCVAVRCAQLVK